MQCRLNKSNKSNHAKDQASTFKSVLSSLFFILSAVHLSLFLLYCIVSQGKLQHANNALDVTVYGVYTRLDSDLIYYRFAAELQPHLHKFPVTVLNRIYDFDNE